MIDRIEYSVNSLQNWTDKILADTTPRINLRAFIEHFNFDQYHAFYKELVPFLEELALKDPANFTAATAVYKQNLLLIEAAMEEYTIKRTIIGRILGIYIPRSSDDLVLALKEVQANIQSFAQAFRIAREYGETAG